MTKVYDRENMKFAIEFVGVPASGKSTIAQRYNGYINLNEKNIYHCNRIIRNIKKSINCILSILFHYKYCKQSLKYLKNIDDFFEKIKMGLYIFSTINICCIARNKKVILEEGMLQVLWGILYSSNNFSARIIEDYLEDFKMLLAGDIISIETDKRIVKERLMKRDIKGGSILIKNVQKDEIAIDRAFEIQEKIIFKLESKGYFVEKINGGEL